MIVAVVNNYEIMDYEYQAELQRVLEKMHLEEPNKEAQKKALDQLIDGYLLLTKAKETCSDVSSDEVDERFVDLTVQFNTEQEFMEVLKKRNIDINTFRDQIRNELIIKKYLHDNFSDNIDVPEDKLKEVYLENKEAFVTQEMIKASHILVRGTEAESLNKINEIRELINNPEDFYREAKKYSECPSGVNSGDLGYFTRGKMVKEFEDAAFKLAINEISAPVKTQFGYHIIMVTDHKASKIADFDDVKDALRKRVQHIESEIKLIRHLKELRLKADIQIHWEKL